MLPKEYRLSKKDIQRIFFQGKRINLEKITLFFLKTNEDKSCPQIAIIISSKICRSAVKRHKIKRVITEIIRKKFLHLFPPDFKIILIIKSSFFKLNNSEIANYLQKVFRQLKLIPLAHN